MSELRHTNPEQVEDITREEAPRNPYAMGYGRKIPTDYMIRYRGDDGVLRWHRVYVMQFSNAGTAYIVSGGREAILDLDTTHAIQEARH